MKLVGDGFRRGKKLSWVEDLSDIWSVFSDSDVESIVASRNLSWSVVYIVYLNVQAQFVGIDCNSTLPKSSDFNAYFLASQILTLRMGLSSLCTLRDPRKVGSMFVQINGCHRQQNPLGKWEAELAGLKRNRSTRKLVKEYYQASSPWRIEGKLRESLTRAYNKIVIFSVLPKQFAATKKDFLMNVGRIRGLAGCGELWGFSGVHKRACPWKYIDFCLRISNATAVPASRFSS